MGNPRHRVSIEYGNARLCSVGYVQTVPGVFTRVLTLKILLYVL